MDSTVFYCVDAEWLCVCVSVSRLESEKLKSSTLIAVLSRQLTRVVFVSLCPSDALILYFPVQISSFSCFVGSFPPPRKWVYIFLSNILSSQSAARHGLTLTAFQPLWSPKSLETCVQLNSHFQNVYLHQRWRENVNIALEGFDFWKCWNVILIKNRNKTGKKWRSRENGRAVLTAVAGSWTHAVIQTTHTFYYPCIYRTWMCGGTHKHSHTHLQLVSLWFLADWLSLHSLYLMDN